MHESLGEAKWYDPTGTHGVWISPLNTRGCAPSARMSGSGVGDTLNAAFAALSAQSSGPGRPGLLSNLSEVQQFLGASDDRSFTEAIDRRCRAYDGLGLSKPGKVALTNVETFKPDGNLPSRN